ncbi:MAG: phosphoribosylglycinamide formyltransferase [Chitinophagaceae bacterium]|nr:phosphoribosylglycinamide formyltransferase [Chitinophagaceae bacterium]
MKRIAIFASGMGTNAAKIIERFTDHPSISVALIVSNKPTAGVLNIATKNNIETLIIDRASFNDVQYCLVIFKDKRIDWIVLAGFLWKMPAFFVDAYPLRIINIHPALLPKYGGKGMYGMHVHEAVVAEKEKETGITIHYVNEHYDEGAIIFQAKCEVLPSDTAEKVAEKVHQLEHRYFPEVIERLLSV